MGGALEFLTGPKLSVANGTRSIVTSFCGKAMVRVSAATCSCTARDSLVSRRLKSWWCAVPSSVAGFNQCSAQAFLARM